VLAIVPTKAHSKTKGDLDGKKKEIRFQAFSQSVSVVPVSPNDLRWPVKLVVNAHQAPRKNRQRAMVLCANLSPGTTCQANFSHVRSRLNFSKRFIANDF
jgi:hypothetical protein